MAAARRMAAAESSATGVVRAHVGAWSAAETAALLRDLVLFVLLAVPVEGSCIGMQAFVIHVGAWSAAEAAALLRGSELLVLLAKPSKG
eukprot:1156840-Pelagomonas_calceolata.AAC.9